MKSHVMHMVLYASCVSLFFAVLVRRERRAQLKLAVPGHVTARRELEQTRIDQRLAELRLEHARSSLEHLGRRSEAFCQPGKPLAGFSFELSPETAARG